MLRNYPISLRIAMLLVMILAFVLIISSVFWYGMNNIRDLGIQSTETRMLDGQKDKIKVATHSVALLLQKSINPALTQEQQDEVFRNLVDLIRFESDESGYFFIYRGTVNVALPIKKERVGKDLATVADKNGVLYVKELFDQASKGGGFVEYVFPKPGKGDVAKISYSETVPGTDLWVGTGVYLDNVDDARQEIRQSIEAFSSKLLLGIGIGLGLVLIVVIIPSGLAIRRSITKPINEALVSVEQVAKGDLTIVLNDKYSDEVGQLNGSLKKMVEQLRNIAQQVKSSAVFLATNSGELNSAVEQMAQGASEQASGAEEVAASMEQMEANIRQAADNASQTDKMATQASAQAEESGKAVQQAVEVMRTIAEKITVVEDISRQTNLLAINAAIEAARAGEHGRGFAAVAQEVKKLAERAQTAAAEINELSRNSTEVSEKAGLIIQNLVPNILKTAGLVQEITASAKELSVGAEEVSKAVNQFDQVAQQNAATAEEISATSENLSKQADNLNELTGFFKV